MTALPTFVAAGTSGLTPSLPTGWAENDIFILAVDSGGKVRIPDGWLEVPFTPPPLNSASSFLTVMWRRATASESSPTLVAANDHTVAAIMAFRGCAIRGKPWNKLVGGNDTSANTTRTAAGFTTTVNNCLVVIIQQDGRDVAGATLSGWTNADLGSITEHFDEWTSAGGGGGWGAASGTKATAGSVGDTTATATGSIASSYITIALKPAGEEDVNVYSGPYFVARGTADSRNSAGNIVPGLPTGWQEHDVFILLCESGGTVAAPSGWAAIPNSPQSITALSILTGFWRRASSSESAPNVAFPTGGDHITGQIAAFRGCHPEGDPWDVQAGATDSTSDNTGNMVGGTVGTDNTLVLTMLGNGSDSLLQQTLDWRPHDEATDAINYYVCLDSWTSIGGGGGIAMTAWEMLAAGSFAARQCDLLTANTNVSILLGIKAGPGPVSSVDVAWIT